MLYFGGKIIFMKRKVSQLCLLVLFLLRQNTFAQTCNAGIIKADKDSICFMGGPAHLIDNGSVGVIQWQSSITTSSFSNIIGAKDSFLYNTPLKTTYYRVYVTNGSCSDTSSAYKIVVNPVAEVNFSHTINFGTRVTFSVTGNLTGIISYQWDFGDGNSLDTSASSVNRVFHPGGYHVCLTTRYTYNCSYIVCNDLTILPTGTDDIEVNRNRILLSNLVSDYLEVTASNVFSLGIRNLLGQEILDNYSIQNKGNKQLIDVRYLPDGIYFFHAQTKHGLKTEKFIVRHR